MGKLHWLLIEIIQEISRFKKIRKEKQGIFSLEDGRRLRLSYTGKKMGKDLEDEKHKTISLKCIS